MTSTRNKNTKGDYVLEQKAYSLVEDYSLYQHSASGPSYKSAIPEIGYTPSKMSRDEFSSNAIDIESELRGIGTTNLVNSYSKVIPDYKTLHFKPFFRHIPLIMPKPLVIENNQRPFPIPK
jgi:hypothetical protein